MKWLDLRDPDVALMLLCAGFTAGAVVASRKYHTLDKGWHRLGWNVRCKCGRKMKAGVQIFVPGEVIVNQPSVVVDVSKDTKLVAIDTMNKFLRRVQMTSPFEHPLAAAIQKEADCMRVQMRTARFGL